MLSTPTSPTSLTRNTAPPYDYLGIRHRRRIVLRHCALAGIELHRTIQYRDRERLFRMADIFTIGKGLAADKQRHARKVLRQRQRAARKAMRRAAK